MHHIAHHLRLNEFSINDIRPDFHFIDHIHDIGLIGDEKFKQLRMYSEMPQFPNFRPAGLRPARPKYGLLEVEASKCILEYEDIELNITMCQDFSG